MNKNEHNSLLNNTHTSDVAAGVQSPAQLPLLDVEVLPKIKAKQEAFLDRYFSNGKNLTEAYRYAYEAQGSNSNTVWKEAHKLFKNPKLAPHIKIRSEKAREIIAQNFEYNILDAFNALALAEELALNNKKVFQRKYGGFKEIATPDFEAIVKITALKSKLAGIMDSKDDNPTGNLPFSIIVNPSNTEQE